MQFKAIIINLYLQYLREQAASPLPAAAGHNAVAGINRHAGRPRRAQTRYRRNTLVANTLRERWLMPLQKATFRAAKDGLLRSKRRPFTL